MSSLIEPTGPRKLEAVIKMTQSSCREILWVVCTGRALSLLFRLSNAKIGSSDDGVCDVFRNNKKVLCRPLSRAGDGEIEVPSLL